MLFQLSEPGVTSTSNATGSYTTRRPDRRDPRKLTGMMVLMILLGFFGTIGLVDAVMVWSALSTFSGQVSARPYEDGLAYNRAIAEAEQQNSLGWRADAKLGMLDHGRARIELALANRSGEPLSDLTVVVTLSSPVNKALDKIIKLAAAAPGHYLGKVEIAPGKRMLGIDVQDKGKTVYHSVSRILLAEDSN